MSSSTACAYALIMLEGLRLQNNDLLYEPETRREVLGLLVALNDERSTYKKL